MITIKVVSQIEDFLSVANTWNELLSRSVGESIFLSHEWISCFWRVWAHDGQLMILLAYEDDKLIGIAPLMLLHSTFLGLPIRKLSFIENDETPHCGFIIDRSVDTKKVLSAFFEFIISKINNWDIISLRKIPQSSSIIEFTRNYLKIRKYRSVCESSLSSPFLAFESDWDTFYSNTSQRFKKRIKYSLNKIKNKGVVSIQESSSPDEINAILPEVFAVGARSWKGKPGKSIGGTSQRSHFFSMLPQALEPIGRTIIWTLKLDDKIVAFEYHIQHNLTAYSLRGEFDENYRSWGPGSVLDYEIIRRLFDSDITTYDMCGSADEYKLRWTSTTINYNDLLIFNRNSYGALLSILEKEIKPAVKWFVNLKAGKPKSNESK